MNKELAAALADYLAQLSSVVADIAESHYWNGKDNKQVRMLRAHEAALIQTIHASVTTAVLPPTPEVRGSAAAP